MRTFLVMIEFEYTAVDDQGHPYGFCRKVRFLGKIRKSGIKNSMTYRLLNSRKSNFATEPLLVATAIKAQLWGWQVLDIDNPLGGVWHVFTRSKHRWLP